MSSLAAKIETEISITEVGTLNDVSEKKFKSSLSSTVKSFISKEGLLGNYEYAYLFTPNIYPFNRKYKDYKQPFFAIDERIPILLTLILGFQHAFTLITSLVAVPLLMGDALYFNSAQTQHLVSCSLIIAGITTFAQITRIKIFKTPYYIGTGLLSVVGPTFDVIGIAYSYSASRYAKGTCPMTKDGTNLPCEDAFGAILGTMLCTVWIQVFMAFIPPRYLKRIFPSLVTGTLLLLLTIYLTSSGMKNWGGGSPCYGNNSKCDGGTHPNYWGARSFIGLGFSTFISIILIEVFGSPLMKSSAIILGLLIGCIISSACGYWDASGINSAPVGDFLWTKDYKYSVDGALVLPFLIMFCVEGVSCIPDILATAEASQVSIENDEFQSRIQGGIMCDALGSVLAACGGGLPIVSQAANNGVVIITGCASRRAGWTAAIILLMMVIFSKISATFAALPNSVFGGMQVYLFGTIGVASIKIMSTIPWNRRNKFILSSALGMGFAGNVVPDWFDNILKYDGSNQSLAGFLEGIELIVETPFIFGATIACILNLVIPEEGETEELDNDAEMV